MRCGIGRRHCLDLALLWLWSRPAATAPIGYLAWEPPCAAGEALKRPKKYIYIYMYMYVYIYICVCVCVYMLKLEHRSLPSSTDFLMSYFCSETDWVVGGFLSGSCEIQTKAYRRWFKQWHHGVQPGIFQGILKENKWLVKIWFDPTPNCFLRVCQLPHSPGFSTQPTNTAFLTASGLTYFFFFNWGMVDAHYYINLRCTT